jgi:putative transposase
MPSQPSRKQSTQSWMTFVRNHAKSVIACDFFVVVTATLRLVYVFVIMEIGTRRILHFNVTTHPNAEWTMQQFRECLTGQERYRFVIHDRDAIYSKDVDLLLKTTGLQILKTPAQSPQANAFCERLIGTIRRECLDFMIPLSGSHVRRILKSWVVHYNRGRPHSSLGPGIPEGVTSASISCEGRHHIPPGYRVIDKPVLGGLHHEYGLENIAA